MRNLAIAVLMLALSSTLGAEPLLEKTVLFEAGKDGYALYRIPGLVVTPKGTLLAYCEARKSASGDWGHIDIVLRRSTDGGKTWQPRQQIVKIEGNFERNPAALAQNLGKPGEVTINNPVAIVDQKTHAIHFLYCVEYFRCFYMRSDDDGLTFSAPIEITGTFEKFKPEYDWKVIATGPAHGIQLKSGRLLVPVWMSTGKGGHAHRPSVVSTIFSDDAGKTWQRGELAAVDGDLLKNPNETVALELADGRVMLNMRSESKENRRALTYSADGATGWTKPVFHEQLFEPICMASTTRLSSAASGGRNRILFANPHNLDVAKGEGKPGQSRRRRNLSVKMSYDEGQSWPVNKPLEPGVSGYSDLAVGSDQAIYCLYECGSAGNDYQTKTLTLARFNIEWLTDGKDSLDQGASK
ncbi:MAG TPA: sialidase family protein [Planctomycetota bacterium]|nr:sialidase family protein [Planctomycetota bacterium]